MTALFLKLFNQSVAASWLILAVLCLRLLLKKAPKRFSVLLWGLVAVRALCPFSLQSALSLLPRAQPVGLEIMMSPAPQIESGVAAINNVVNPVLAGSFTLSPVASANPLQIWLPILAALWLTGAAGMALYAVFSYARLCRRVRTAVLLRDNIFCTEAAPSPFLLGILRPRVYLPFGMEERAQEAALAHEQAHIWRKDHWWKLTGFAVLSLHWMNPLMWLAYALLCRDIELACDESVIREMDGAHRADYSEALLACSAHTGRDARPLTLRVCPLTFSEGDVKSRVKAVLQYHQPAVWVVAAAVAACALAAVCFLTDPASAAETDNASDSLSAGTVYVSDRCLYMSPASSFSAIGGSGCSYTIEKDSFVINPITGASPYRGEIHIPVSHWGWQSFPFTDEEWETGFAPLFPDNVTHIRSQYKDILYQPLNNSYFLLSVDGTPWLVELRGGLHGDIKLPVWSIYSLTRQTEESTLYTYNIEEAAQMVDSVEWLCAWLQTQDTISRADAQRLIAAIDEAVPNEGTNTLLCHMADAADWENPGLQTLSLRHDMIAPTVYHTDVSFVSATEERYCALEHGESTCTYHNSFLCIRKEYTGDDPAFADWYSEYIFTRREHDGPWVFTAMNGTYNIEGSLPLKEAFYTGSYAGFSPS